MPQQPPIAAALTEKAIKENRQPIRGNDKGGSGFSSVPQTTDVPARRSFDRVTEDVLGVRKVFQR